VDSGFQLNQIEVAPHLDIFPKKKIDVWLDLVVSLSTLKERAWASTGLVSVLQALFNLEKQRPGRSTRLSLATNRTVNWLWSVFFFSPLTSYMYYLQKLAPSII
jgi:hypothetical protein